MTKDPTATAWWQKFGPGNSELVAYRGSVVHGAYRPNSDIDIAGIFIAPLDHYLGRGQTETRDFFENEYDCVFHELRKAIFLLGNCNPNVLDLMWLRKEDYLHVSDLGQQLIDNRDLFVSKQIYHTFTGYAYGQMHKMTTNFASGYDAKNAATMIRLLTTAKETLSDGKLRVYRPDFQLYLDVKDAKFTLEQVKEMATQLFAETKTACEKSPLPEEVDRDKVEKLCVNLLKQKFGIA